MPLIRPLHLEPAGQGEMIDPVTLAFSDPDAAVRRQWARVLGQTPNSSAELIAQLPLETDDSVRTALVTALVSQADTAAVDALLACLPSADVWLRNEAVSALQLLVNLHAEPVLEALENAVSDVQILLLVVLETLQNPALEAHLLRLLGSTQDLNVCAGALQLLSEIATPNAYAELLACRARFADQDYLMFLLEQALHLAQGADAS